MDILLKKFLLLFLYALCCNNEVKAQTYIQKVLIIDTLILPNKKFMFEINSEKFKIKMDRYPNFCKTIFEEDTGAAVYISLDDVGGKVCLKNIFKQNFDTLRIHKLRVFHNCSSIFQVRKETEYMFFPSYRDAPSKLKKITEKTYEKKITKRACKGKYPDSLELHLSGKSYNAALMKVEETTVSISHGIDTKTEDDNALRKSNLPYRCFVYYLEMNQYFLKAEINLPY